MIENFYKTLRKKYKSISKNTILNISDAFLKKFKYNKKRL